MRVCRSPWLIAAYHGLHRLCVPRHPPHAIARLTTKSRRRQSGPKTAPLSPPLILYPKQSTRDTILLPEAASFTSLLQITSEHSITLMLTQHQRLACSFWIESTNPTIYLSFRFQIAET